MSEPEGESPTAKRGIKASWSEIRNSVGEIVVHECHVELNGERQLAGQVMALGKLGWAGRCRLPRTYLDEEVTRKTLKELRHHIEVAIVDWFKAEGLFEEERPVETKVGGLVWEDRGHNSQGYSGPFLVVHVYAKERGKYQWAMQFQNIYSRGANFRKRGTVGTFHGAKLSAERAWAKFLADAGLMYRATDDA